MCEVGDRIELRLEPDNPADENAVAVYSAGGMQIGYITSVRAVRISALLRDGREIQAVLQRKTKFGAWIRVAFDGERPALTSAMLEDHDEPEAEPVREEPDFYPDEVWPDD
ncbi:hypothetical protein A8V01_02640 [Novosphingobium guangzhouense]|uniref:HIRAN domain-containing protein n=2 Tax=Novosphingobium guangzhouense TaxID=1850347 RepID=A0A2K2G6E2_9SPHN|nr:hypothetical protein A8V01_02640 [Novosphingobium guangzhouense]